MAQLPRFPPFAKDAKDGAPIFLSLLGESREFDQVGCGDLLYRVASFAPGGQTSSDDEGAEAVLSEYQRHTGAGSFALSSAIDVDVFVLGESFQFFGELVRFHSDGSRDPRATA